MNLSKAQQSTFQFLSREFPTTFGLTLGFVTLTVLIAGVLLFGGAPGARSPEFVMQLKVISAVAFGIGLWTGAFLNLLDGKLTLVEKNDWSGESSPVTAFFFGVALTAMAVNLFSMYLDSTLLQPIGKTWWEDLLW